MNNCFYSSGIRCLKFNSRLSKDDCKICRYYKNAINPVEAGKTLRNILDKLNKEKMEDCKMKLNIKNLENCFNKADDEGFEYVGIKISMDDLKKEEVIINSQENFRAKLNYYKNAYNEDLTLKTAPDKIRIVGFTHGTSFSQIEKNLLGVQRNNNYITINCSMNVTETDISKIAKEAHEKIIKSLAERINYSII